MSKQHKAVFIAHQWNCTRALERWNCTRALDRNVNEQRNFNNISNCIYIESTGIIEKQHDYCNSLLSITFGLINPGLRCLHPIASLRVGSPELLNNVLRRGMFCSHNILCEKCEATCYIPTYVEKIAFSLYIHQSYLAGFSHFAEASKYPPESYEVWPQVPCSCTMSSHC